MPLKMRKILYASLTLMACVVWLPLAFAGIALLIGVVGILSIGALLRAIFALPITDKFRRRYFSAAIGTGIVTMCGFIIFASFNLEFRTFILPFASGIVLAGVGLAVLAEIHASRP